MSQNPADHRVHFMAWPEQESPRHFNHREENVARRRHALARLIDSHGLTQTAFARFIGLRNANLIINLMAGRSKSLSQDVIEKILVAFPSVSFEELVGWSAPGSAHRASLQDPEQVADPPK